MLIRPVVRGRTGSVRAGAAAAVIGVLLAGCVSAEPPPADVPPVVIPAVTTQPAIPPEPVTDDVITLVEDYWEARDAAFAAGAEAGITFIVANNHPLLSYTAEQCRDAWFGGEVPIGFSERTALLDGSIESDPGWTMVQGPLAGRDLGSGLLEMVVAFSYEGEGLRVADRVSTVHLQVTGGTVRQFLLCEQVDVIVAPAPTTAAVAPGTGTAPGTSTGTTPGTTTSPTTTTPTATTPTTPITTPQEPTTLPPITAVPVPVAPPAVPTTPTPTPTPTPPTGTRPPGSGIDFCREGDPGAQPIAGDYWLCPDSDVTNIEGEDGGSSEPDPNPAPTDAP